MQMTKIMDMRSFMSDINTTFIVLEKLQNNQGATTQYLVADETAAIHLHIWEGDFAKMTGNAAAASTSPTDLNDMNKQASLKKGVESSMLLNPGDICRIIGGKCTVFKSSLGLYIGKGSLERINDFCMIFNENKNMSQIEFNAQNQQQQQQQQQVR